MSSAEIPQTDEPERRIIDAREQLLDTLPVTERFVDAAGVSTAIIEGGEGPPMVLLHGPGESALWWLRILPDLVTEQTIIAPDLPGHGESRVADNPLSHAGVVEWLDRIIDKTCHEPPILVGHILGGAIAARYAAAHGDRLRALVLVDTLGLSRFRPAPMFAIGLLRFMVRSNERSYNQFLGQCMVDQGRLVREMGDAWDPFVEYSLGRSKSPRVKSAMRTLMREFGRARIPRETLEAIPVPTTLIWGRADKATRLSVARKAHERYGWPLHVIEDAADDPKMEQPVAFVRTLRSIDM